MRGRVRAAALLLAFPAAACATLPPGIATPADLAVKVATDVCIPYVVQGAAFSEVRRVLDGGWSQELPNLLTSGPPGPVLHRGSAELSIVPERINPASGSGEPRVCIIMVRGSDTEALIAATEPAFRLRAVGPGDDPEIVPARYCLTLPSGQTGAVWVLRYPALNPLRPLERRVGLSVSLSSRGGCA